MLRPVFDARIQKVDVQQTDGSLDRHMAAIDSMVNVLRFDDALLIGQLEQLSIQHRAAFAAACAQRLIPCYFEFSRNARWGDPERLASILGRLWNDLFGKRLSDLEIESDISSCLELMPREDQEPWSKEQPQAEDAAAAVAYALRCRRSGLSTESAWSARRAYEAVDCYASSREGVDFGREGAEIEMLRDPVVQRELTRQQRDIKELHGATINVAELKNRAIYEAQTFLIGANTASERQITIKRF